MHAFRNRARRKHFISGDGDLDHRLVRQQVGILVTIGRKTYAAAAAKSKLDGETVVDTIDPVELPPSQNRIDKRS